MFEFLNKIIRPATREGVVAQLEELCGDELYHGQNQVQSSLGALEDRLSFSENKNQTPVCFAVDCTGFWDFELSSHWTISKVASVEELAQTRIPVYIYALKEGASYKVAVSSRYLPEFKNKDYGHYSEVMGDLSAYSANNDLQTSFMLKFATYSSDLMTILNNMEKLGQIHAVYRLV